MDLQRLYSRFQQRDRLALARLLSLAAGGEASDDVRRALDRDNNPARAGTGSTAGQVAKSSTTVAITGGGGVGKSTLIGRLIELARKHSQTVAVLACDPQSSVTGGALLGDRIRMPSRPDDMGVFIRSVATPGGHSGVAPNIDLMVRLLRKFGFHFVLLETVGAGQGDTAVREVADVVVVLVQPETGDELQWEKAGQLEIADIVVVHKADLPGADRTESQLRDLLNLPGCRSVVVARVSSNKQEGIDEVWEAIQYCATQQVRARGGDR
jgi:LAO/AO transport system ATPase